MSSVHVCSCVSPTAITYQILTLVWQINESFKKFGILDNTSNVLLVMITQEDAVEKVGLNGT